MCGENHGYHELHPLNKCLSVQHNIVNSRYNVAWQIFKAYSSCLTETLCPLMSYISSLPLGPGNHHSTLILQFWLCLHASRLNASVRVCVHSVAQSCLTLQYYGLQPARLPCPWDFPGKNTGVFPFATFPSPGDLPDPGTETAFLASPALADGFFTIVPPGKLLDKWNHAEIENSKHLEKSGLLYTIVGNAIVLVRKER